MLAIKEIQFVDLSRQYHAIKDEIDNALQECLENAEFIGGSKVKQFEKEWAEFLGVKNCIACANGTDSIEILLESYGIGNGDEVIIPAHTWMSTGEAVVRQGAVPVFVDSHPDYFTIDVTKIEEKITNKTKAIIPVHLYGLPADLDPIMALAKKYNLIVIEDCAQAHNAFYKGKITGSIGHSSSFSFYPGKNLGAFGDAGCMVTNDDEIADRARMIANHGQTFTNGVIKKHSHTMSGRNSRLDTIQAAVLSVKLRHLREWTIMRQKNAKLYSELFENTGIKTPAIPEGSTHVFHLYVIQVENRDQLVKDLSKRGINTAIHYPGILPQMKAFENSGSHLLQFPVSQVYQHKILSIPMFAELTEDEIKYIAQSVIELTR